MKTLFLNTISWDLTLDSGGNIAVASDPYSLVQDAASAIRTFLGDLYYAQDQGIPYFQGVLGIAPPPLSLYRELCRARVLQVPGIADAKIFFTKFSGRTLQGQVQITAASGASYRMGF